MSLIYAELLVALFLFFSGEALYFYLEVGAASSLGRVLLRTALSVLAPVIVAAHGGFWIGLLLILLFAPLFIFSSRVLRPFVRDHELQILLDLPFFDLSNRFFLSALCVILIYWMLSSFFIFAVWG